MLNKTIGGWRSAEDLHLFCTFGSLIYHLNVKITMARTYDRLIRYYDSWLDDIQDPDKGYTAAEQMAILLAIRDAQRFGTFAAIDALPPHIKRGLQLPTLREQIGRIIERTERARARGRDAAAARYAQEQREEEQQRQRQAREEARKGAITREQYLALKERAAAGDQEAVKALQGGAA